MQYMLTRFKPVLWLPLMTAVVASASPVVMDLAQSRVEIFVKATVDSFEAKLQIFDVSVSAMPKTGQIESATFRFKFVSIKTGIDDRDRDMNQWQQTDRFPDVVFTLAGLEPATRGSSVARGRLRFHGVERSVIFPISIRTEGHMITICSRRRLRLHGTSKMGPDPETTRRIRFRPAHSIDLQSGLSRPACAIAPILNSDSFQEVLMRSSCRPPAPRIGHKSSPQ